MALEFGIALPIPIFVVAEQRMAGERRVNADLMRAPGRNIHLHQRREAAEELHRLEHAHRGLAGAATRTCRSPCWRPSVASGASIRLVPSCQLPGHQTHIGLVHAATRGSARAAPSRGPVPRDPQTAAGVAVETVDEFESLARPRCAQGFDDAEAHAAAAVHGDAARLVDHQEVSS